MSGLGPRFCGTHEGDVEHRHFPMFSTDKGEKQRFGVLTQPTKGCTDRVRGVRINLLDEIRVT